MNSIRIVCTPNQALDILRVEQQKERPIVCQLDIFRSSYMPIVTVEQMEEIFFHLQGEVADEFSVTVEWEMDCPEMDNHNFKYAIYEITSTMTFSVKPEISRFKS